MRASKEIKHLLLLTPGFPDGEADSNCVPAVQQFVRAYRMQFPDTRITIIALHYPFQTPFYKWYGIDVYSMCGQNRNGLQRMHTLWKATRTASSINKKNKIDAILALWFTDAALVAKYISRTFKVPYGIWMHGQDARAGNKYINRIKPHENQLIAISTYQKAILKKENRVDAGHVVNNGLVTSLFPELNTGIRNIDMLAAGSLVPLKQNYLFVQLVKDVRDSGYENIKAVLIGEGEEEQELKRMIHTLGLQKNIEMVGKISHEATLEMMNNTKLFIHPSSYEGHSTVMLEALYSGCEVLALLPVADKPVPHFTQCRDMAEMRSRCIVKLNQEKTPSRVLVSDMNDSAKQIQSILLSIME